MGRLGSDPMIDGIFFQLCFILLLWLSCRRTILSTLEPRYKIVHYKMLLNIRQFKVGHKRCCTQTKCIATDKRGYPHNILFISLLKHMLWVLIGSASPRLFQ